MILPVKAAQRVILVLQEELGHELFRFLIVIRVLVRHRFPSVVAEKEQVLSSVFALKFVLRVGLALREGIKIFEELLLFFLRLTDLGGLIAARREQLRLVQVVLQLVALMPMAHRYRSLRLPRAESIRDILIEAGTGIEPPAKR